MGSTLGFAEYIAGQIDSAGEVSYRKMFGEYAFYVNGKVVALLSDNQLYIKPTEGGRLFIGDVVEAKMNYHYL